jgi:hypothetical protein
MIAARRTIETRSLSAQAIVALVPVLCALGSVAVAPDTVAGFDERDTHPRITERAARQSTVDSSLKDELNVPDGIDANLKGPSGTPQRVFQWLRRGATSEDQPMCRASNHFHNPLQPFTSSRVTDVPLLGLVCSDFQSLQSNVTWGTRFVSPAERGPATLNPSDWDSARKSFLDALALPGAAAREAAMAQTFETLGHVMHLVQDMAVPAHVRNNLLSHAGVSLSPLKFGVDGFEDHVRLNRDTVNAATPAPVDVAGRLLTRFWDTDRYTGTNPSSDTEQGLAEYTNANFVSLSTILTDGDFLAVYRFPYPRLSSTNVETVVSKDATAVRIVTAEDGREDRAVYLDKVRDGEMVPNFLRAGYLAGHVIDRAPPGTPIKLALQLDDTVYASYAAKLVPMALGYSKGLLDYFFRGKLDVDVVANDDGTLAVSGTNTSSDPLVRGDLVLYADTVTQSPGTPPVPVRRLLVPLGDTTIAGVAPGQAVVSTAFQSEEAERFVAVYTGQLGAEIPAPNDDPARALPGAVIGKVLGGVRVEEVFLYGDRWAIRTPQQIVLLADSAGPMSAARYEDVRWGDGDHLLVARTSFGPGQPNTVALYAVPRATDPATGDPLTIATLSSDEGPVATLSDAALFTLPGDGIHLGTTVTIDHTIAYRQQIPSYPKIAVYQFQPFSPGSPFGNYVFDRFEVGALTLRTAVDLGVPFTESFPLVLDAAHYNAFSPVAPSYAWTLTEVGATADGRMLGLVRIDLTAPPFSQRARVSQPVYAPTLGLDLVVRRVCFGGSCFDEGVNIVREYPSGTFWALVDLSSGQGLASTAAPLVSFTLRQSVEAPRWIGAADGPAPLVYAVHYERRRGGGPQDTPEGQDQKVGLVELSQLFLDDGQPGDATGDLALDLGRSAQSAGVLRAEIASLLAEAGLHGTVPGPGTPPADLLFGSGQDRVTLHVTTSAPASVQKTVSLDQAQRVRPAGATERLVLQADGTRNGKTTTALLDWTTTSQARLAQLLEPGPGEFFVSVDLGPATPSAVLVRDPANARGYLVALDDTAAFRTIPDSGALSGFTLLNPQLLYNTQTLRFHRADASLRQTALPMRLQDLAGNPTGDYHAVRLP